MTPVWVTVLLEVGRGSTLQDSVAWAQFSIKAPVAEGELRDRLRRVLVMVPIRTCVSSAWLCGNYSDHEGCPG